MKKLALLLSTLPHGPRATPEQRGKEDGSLAEFARPRRGYQHHPYARDHLTAALITLFMGWALVALLTEPSLWMTRAPMMFVEPVIELLPAIRKPVPPLPLPFLMPLLRPKLESFAPPQFLIQPGQTAIKSRLTSVGTDATPECSDAEWNKAVLARLASVSYYPKYAKQLGITGEVDLSAWIESNGVLSKLEISKSSGRYVLDSSALNIVELAQPPPPVPARMHAPRVNWKFAFRFGTRATSSTFIGSNAPPCADASDVDK
jgi:TonB family protein